MVSVCYQKVSLRETLERGDPCRLLKMRHMGTQGVLHMTGVLPWLVSLGSSCRCKRFLFCLGCSSRPRTKYLFPHRIPTMYFISFVPIAQEAGQAEVPVRLCLNTCLWSVPIGAPSWHSPCTETTPVASASEWGVSEPRFYKIVFSYKYRTRPVPIKHMSGPNPRSEFLLANMV
jgi:hypothetical protein